MNMFLAVHMGKLIGKLIGKPIDKLESAPNQLWSRSLDLSINLSINFSNNAPRLSAKFLTNKFLIKSLTVLVLCLLFSQAPNCSNAYAIDAPELLPSYSTNVIDLGKFLNQYQEEELDQELSQFEQKTGWKLRVLTQVDRTPGRAVKDYWGLNERSVMLVADTTSRNILNFNVGDAVYDLLPRTFWIELQSRYGNQFYVREQGQDQAILASVRAIIGCLEQDGCAVVPGLPQEQWLLTLVTSILGGIIFGFAGHPRKEGEIFAWKWALVLTPLWGMLLISFGLGPVLSRTNEWLPIVRNLAGFIGGAVFAYLIPAPKRNPKPL